MGYELDLDDVAATHPKALAELEVLRADAARLDWLEQQTREGACPALVFDDNGHWAVAFDGMQNCPTGQEPEDIQTTFFIEAADWYGSPREAIDAEMALDARKGAA